MKKKFMKSGLLVTLLSVGVLTGCGAKECVHEGGNATCTELAVCEKCGEAYGELAAHNYDQTLKHNSEKHWKECVCGDKTEISDHEFVAGEILKEPTHFEEGSQIYTCVCGESKTETLEIIPHTYSEEYKYDETNHWFECECGDKKDVVPHTFVPGKVTKEATCKEEGTQEYNCVCGATKVEKLSIIPHTYSDTYSFDEENHWHGCTCGDKKDLEAHTFVPGEVKSESTCTVNGIQEYTCSCGATKDVELPLVPHKDEDLDIYCDYGCKKKIVPAYDTLLTCKVANALANAQISLSGNHYVKGEVVEVSDAKNGIFLIQDDSNETFKLRLVKGEGGIAYKDFECKILVGDYIQAYGKISRDVNAPYTPRMEGPIVTYIKQHPHTYGDATCLLPATCECGHVSGEPLGHTDEDKDGLCDRCSFDVNNVLVTLPIMTKEGMTVSEDQSSLSWSNDVIEFQIQKGTSSQLYTSAQEHARIYKNNVMVVKTKGDVAIKSLKIFSTSADYAKHVYNSFKAKEYECTLEDTAIVFSTVPATLEAPNTSGTTRINSIEIVYPKPAPEKEPTVVDFNTITCSNSSGGDSGYTNEYTTASGWTVKNCAIQVGGSTVMNPAYPVVGPDKTHKAICLNGKTSAPGTLISPTLKDGLSEINIDYTKIFSDTLLSVTIKVTELSSGKVYEHTISAELAKTDKYTVYQDSWKLETPVEGDYTIVITNNCPSNVDGNKDRITLLKVEYK